MSEPGKSDRQEADKERGSDFFLFKKMCLMCAVHVKAWTNAFDRETN